MTHAPRRRWPRFTLRTMFALVTVAIVLVGYPINWIRQRHEVMAKSHVLRRAYTNIVAAYPEPSAPGLLWLFGEQGYSHVELQFDPAGDFPLSQADNDEVRHKAATSHLERVEHIKKKVYTLASIGMFSNPDSPGKMKAEVDRFYAEAAQLVSQNP